MDARNVGAAAHEYVSVKAAKNTLPARRTSGAWRKGQSGNPKGRVKGSLNKRTASLKAYAGQFTEEAIDALVAIARGTRTPQVVKVAAWREVLDRGNGRPPQSVDVLVSRTLEDILAESYETPDGAAAPAAELGKP